MKYKARLLGRPELFVDGTPYIFTFKKAQILALMLVEEKSMSKDKICEYLWSDKTLEKARRNLSNAVSCIKKVLPVVHVQHRITAAAVLIAVRSHHPKGDVHLQCRQPGLVYLDIHSTPAFSGVCGEDEENWSGVFRSGSNSFHANWDSSSVRPSGSLV